MRISVLEEGTAAVLGQARTWGSSAMAPREEQTRTFLGWVAAEENRNESGSSGLSQRAFARDCSLVLFVFEKIKGG